MKTENQMLKTKNPQTVMNAKTKKPKSFGTKTEKPIQKNSQNRKTENPNAPLLNIRAKVIRYNDSDKVNISY